MHRVPAATHRTRDYPRCTQHTEHDTGLVAGPQVANSLGETVVHKLRTQQIAARSAIEAGDFGRPRPLAEPVATHQPCGRPPVAPLAVDDDCGRHHLAQPAGALQPPQRILVLCRTEHPARTEQRVEAAERRPGRPSYGEVRAMAEQCDVVAQGDGTGHAWLGAAHRHGRTITLTLYPAQGETDCWVCEGADQGSQPTRLWPAVIVGEGNHLANGVRDAGIAGPGQSRPLTTDRTGAGGQGDQTRLGTLRSAVDDHQIVTRAQSQLNCRQAAGEQLRPVSGAHHDGHPQGRHGVVRHRLHGRYISAVRILVVTAWPPWIEDTDGGALILARHLRELGPRHQIDVLSAGGPAPDTVIDGVARMQAFGQRFPSAIDLGLRRLRSLRDGEPAHVRWVARPALRRALAQALSHSPDVVHLFGWGTAGLWPELGEVPAVHTAVDPWARTIGNRDLPAWRRWTEHGQRAAVERHEARHYPHLSAVVLVSDHDAGLMAQQVPSARFVVVPNGVDAGPEPAPLPAGAPVLAFHGSFRTRANVEAARALVEQLLPLLRVALPGVRVVLAGHAPGPEVLRLAGPEVEVLADVPEVRTVLNRAHLHVDLLVSGGGVKNKVLEALAAGRPVVGTPMALQGLLGEGGTLSVPDASAAAAAIIDLVQRPGALAAAGAAGRRRVLAQTWAASARRLEQLWEQTARR